MVLITINLSEEVINDKKFKEMIKNRQLSEQINKMLKRKFKIKTVKVKDNKPLISIPQQEFKILKFLIKNKIATGSYSIIINKIYNNGLFRQKKRIEESIKRIIYLKLYSLEGQILKSNQLLCPCGARVPILALDKYICPRCKQIIIGEYK